MPESIGLPREVWGHFAVRSKGDQGFIARTGEFQWHFGPSGAASL